MAYEHQKASHRRNFWPISSYGAVAAGVAGGGVATHGLPQGLGNSGPNGNSDFHFLQASTFLQELIDSNRKKGATVKSPPPPPPPPPPQQTSSQQQQQQQGGGGQPAGTFAQPPPPPPPVSSGREAYNMEDGRQRLLPPSNNAQQQQQQQPSPQDNGNGSMGNDQQNWNFMGQKMWPSDKNCQVEDDFRLEYMVEYMELDEFLTENDIPLESVLQDQPQIDENDSSNSKVPSSGGTTSSGTTSASTQPPQQQQQPPHSQNHPPNTQQPPKMGPPLDATSPPLNPQSSSAGGGVSNSGHLDTSGNLIKSECVGPPNPSSHDYGDYGNGGGALPPMGHGAPLCGGTGDKGVISLPPPPPPPPPPLDSSAVASSLLRKRKKQMVSEERKDEKYWERRRKNNMAAKRSRDARRAKETQIAIQATLLERENKNLTQELSKARAENLLLRERLQKYEPV